MSSGAHALRALLERPGMIVGASCYSALTARITEAEGFEAVWCGGHEMVAMHYALPDHGLFTSTEMAGLLAPIADCVSVPVVGDGDQGGETSLNVMHTVRAYERAGVAAIVLEDTVNPKHLYSENDPIQSIDEMCARIAAAAAARTDPDFVIIARTDEFYRAGSAGSLDEVVRRGRAYAEAGADMFFPIYSPPSAINRIADATEIPILDFNHPLSVVRGTKLKMLMYGGPTVHEAAFLHQQMMRHLRKGGLWGSASDWYDGSAVQQPGGSRPEGVWSAETTETPLQTHLSSETFRTLTRNSEYLETGRKWSQWRRMRSAGNRDALQGSDT